MRYMLITVCDREISTKTFDGFDEAQAHMINDLKAEFEREHPADDFNDVIEVFKRDGVYEEHDDYFADDFGFALHRDEAWSNLNYYNYTLDWKIVEIQ